MADNDSELVSGKTAILMRLFCEQFSDLAIANPLIHLITAECLLT